MSDGLPEGAVIPADKEKDNASWRIAACDLILADDNTRRLELKHLPERQRRILELEIFCLTTRADKLGIDLRGFAEALRDIALASVGEPAPERSVVKGAQGQ